MQTKTWRDIWESKRLDSSMNLQNMDTNEVIKELLRCNGFDSKTGSFSIESYRNFIADIFQKAKLGQCDSMYEVGCGAGAFLYAINMQKAENNQTAINSINTSTDSTGGGQMLSQCDVLENPLSTLDFKDIRGFKKLGGIDYSKNLSHIAKLVLPYANITQGEAKDIDSASYDSVCSFGVFHYFPSLQYAKEVIAKMIDKARKKVLFLDILDLDQREADIAYKKQICGDDYEKLYEGTTKHLYCPKDLFVELAESKQCEIYIEQQNIKGYANSPFRFNVIMEKKD
ncbi:hypothetical protein [Helicobacter labetoulli]|uniref:hypothetical protein n=1 Tax=Helicobacter labetoulli TaxID=2315333 RepID=UPI000EF66A71|nr:hypothetical protein [Helicobacter labetoulli]